MLALRFSTRRVTAVVGCLVALAAGLFGIHARRPTSPNRAFYYWKTRWVSSPQIVESLNRSGIGKLYMRFFDVGWDDIAKTPHPISALEFESPLPNGIEIIPVVYVVNNVFLNIPYANVEELTTHVRQKIERMATDEGIRITQIQIDCDWTDASRRNYFHFAELLAQQLKESNRTVSSTIRLHQIKYADRTGIPPVDRGMLMFYNFGRIQADSERSAIFNPEDAGRYATFIAKYPLPLDVVLPVFSWSVHSREGQVLGLLEQLTAQELDSFDGFRKVSPDKYTATRSFFFRGRYFMDGDLVVVQETTPEMTRQAAALAKRGAGKKKYNTVAFFDLDDKHLDKFGLTAIGGALAAF